MAKQNDTMPKIDEDFMRELISQGVPGKQDVGKPDDMPQDSYVENILTRHFEQHQDEINALYESNYQKPF